ncbi:MAG: TonB-dependent receptor [bacterium]|nr:TonB-dependent receptor [bacterium]
MALKAQQQEIEEQLIDEISVTATRTKRKTSEVSASVSVVNSEKLEDESMYNIKDALTSTPGVQIDTKNGGYDSRLVIRGAGLKAAYGVREIMVLLDGVPVTDPDSFTRFDLIDTQNIEQIEVVKGPNSTLWGANAAGGVVNIITKDPLKTKQGSLKVGAGNFGRANANIFWNDNLGGSLFYNLSLSHREAKNDWRRWNEFSTDQVSLAPTWMFEDGSSLETRLVYSQADMQLPGSLDEEMFKTYEETGKAPESTGIWQYSGRYSTNSYLSTRFKKQIGNWEIVPMLYANQWSHRHPVYAQIGKASALNLGTDLQANLEHPSGTLTFGISQRQENYDSKSYAFGDVETERVTSRWASYDKIVKVNSDAEGELNETGKRSTQLSGVYIQESWRPADGWIVDAGVRHDQIGFNLSGEIYRYYSSYTSTYSDCGSTATDCGGTAVDQGKYDFSKNYSATSPRIGVNYRVAPGANVYAALASGIQTPTQGELSSNHQLELVQSINYEMGLKMRQNQFELDSAVYQNLLSNEVVKVINSDGRTEYTNAGKTKKLGFEFSGNYQVSDEVTAGLSYTANDFRFVDYMEPVSSNGTTVLVDRSGNRMAYSPDQMYSLMAGYKQPQGLRASMQADSWGAYYIDSENSQTYEGFQFVTKAMVGYELGRYDLRFNVENLFDQRYAVEVTKSYGSKYYSPAAPRTFLLTLSTKL